MNPGPDPGFSASYIWQYGSLALKEKTFTATPMVCKIQNMIGFFKKKNEGFRPKVTIANSPPQMNKEELSVTSIDDALKELDAASSGIPEVAASVQKKEERIRDRSLYQELLDGLYDAVLIFDPSGRAISGNRRVTKHFGYENDELWNMPAEDLITGITPKVLTKIRSHLENGRFTVVNAVCKAKDGSTFAGEIAIARINLLHEGDLVFSVRNIDRRQKGQEKLAFAAEAIHQAASAFVTSDSWGRIEYVNPAFLRMWKIYEEKDVLGRHITEFWQSPNEAKMLVKQARGSASWSGKLVAVTSDGKLFPVLAVSSPTINKKDEIVRIIFTFSRM